MPRIKGATTEFRKMEGITFNPEQRVLYLALSEINKGMDDTAPARRRTSAAPTRSGVAT